MLDIAFLKREPVKKLNFKMLKGLKPSTLAWQLTLVLILCFGYVLSNLPS